MPESDQILKHMKISASAQDVETFIRYVLSPPTFSIEKHIQDETGKNFSLLFKKRDRTRERDYIYWGGVQIIEWSESTEIVGMWTLKDPDEKQEVLEKRYQWLMNLCHEIREHFFQPAGDGPSTSAVENSNMEEFTTYLPKTNKVQFCKWLSNYSKKKQIENKSYPHRDGWTFNLYYPQDISPDFQSQLGLDAMLTRLIEINEAEDKYTYEDWTMNDAIKLSWLEVGERLKLSIGHQVSGLVIPPLFDVLAEIGQDWQEARRYIWRYIVEQAGKYHVELTAYPFPIDGEGELTLETSKRSVEASKQAVAQISTGKPKMPRKPKRGSGLDVWFDWYHAMNEAGYRMTFKKLAAESGYSHNTFKEAHGRYKLERGID